jgi:hypothetical protein
LAKERGVLATEGAEITEEKTREKNTRAIHL